MKLAILASGNGTNAQAIFDQIRAGRLQASVELVISNQPYAKVLERAAKSNIKHLIVDRKRYPARSEYDAALIDLLLKSRCDLIVLAGYMLLLGPQFFEVFPDKIINIHPALLPAFPGVAGADDALNYGVKITGASVHFVEEKVDSGPLIIQAAVPVNAGEELDTLKSRIHTLEHRIYPQALQWFAEGRIHRNGRDVFLAPGNKRQVRPDGAWFVWPPLEEGF